MSDASSSIASQCALNAARAEAGRVTQRSSPSLQRSTRPPLSDQVRCTPIGLALYYFAYSTFLGWPTLYLEDLFVLPAECGNGAGLEQPRGIAVPHHMRLAVGQGGRAQERLPHELVERAVAGHPTDGVGEDELSLLRGPLLE